MVPDGRGLRQVALQAGDLPAGLRVLSLVLVLAGRVETRQKIVYKKKERQKKIKTKYEVWTTGEGKATEQLS